MKPCARYKRWVALLAVGELHLGARARAERHLEKCPGCRAYKQEIERLSGRLESLSDELSEIAAPQPAGQIDSVCRQYHDHAGLRPAAHTFRRPITLLLGGVGVGMLALFLILTGAFENPPNTESTSPPAESLKAVDTMDGPPTWFRYQWAASQSMEHFNETLHRDGERLLPHTEASLGEGVRF